MNKSMNMIIATARHPRVAMLGVREFRTDLTASFDGDLLDSYDSGREMAHLATLRMFDQCADPHSRLVKVGDLIADLSEPGNYDEPIPVGDVLRLATCKFRGHVLRGQFCRRCTRFLP